MEVYSSPSGRAICSAAPMALTNSRARVGLGDAGAAWRPGRLSTARCGGPAQVGRVGPDGAQQAGGGRAAGVQQCQQQVPRLDGGVAALVGQRRRRR